jgi:nicotinamidase/pyrazinamidase
MTRALIIVDVQNDFMVSGALPVPGATYEFARSIRSLTSKYEHIVATQDWHPRDHVSFASNWENAQPFTKIEIEGKQQDLWPDHCVINSAGANLAWFIEDANPKLIIRKGWRRDVDSYSAFVENDKETRTGLRGYLRELNIKQIDIVGLALEYCVAATALDAIIMNVADEVNVLRDFTRSIGDATPTLEKLTAAGIIIR